MAEKPHVDILCVVDGESLLEHVESGTSFNSHDTTIGKYCRMITRYKDAQDHLQDSPDLVVTGRVGNIIRWRATSLTLDEECDVEIKSFYGFSHGVCETPKSRPSKDGRELVWWTRIDKPSSDVESYWLNFTVTTYDEAGNQKQQAQYDWDPGIRVIP